jgi:hypothetical protein
LISYYQFQIGLSTIFYQEFAVDKLNDSLGPGPSAGTTAAFSSLHPVLPLFG